MCIYIYTYISAIYNMESMYHRERESKKKQERERERDRETKHLATQGPLDPCLLGTHEEGAKRCNVHPAVSWGGGFRTCICYPWYYD